MLIIFDLDDTLIDTSNEIGPYQLRRTLNSLIDQGLEISNRSQAHLQISFLHQKLKSSTKAIEYFLYSLDASKKYFDIAEEEMNKLLPQDFKVNGVKDVDSVLKKLQTDHILCLVTIGKKDYQLQKLQKAGIDPVLFSKIVVSENKIKKNHYKALFEEFKFDPLETVICGDKIDIDLAPAKELGSYTVQKLKANQDSEGSKNYIDFKIKEIKEIIPIIQTLEKGKKWY